MGVPVVACPQGVGALPVRVHAAAAGASYHQLPTLSGMHKPKPYKCSICGAEVPDLPMPVLKHQLSHVRPRPFARDRQEPERPDDQQDDRKPAER